MGFFARNQNKVRYGVLIDIGSGSVLAAIVSSNPTLKHPDIIWSKREYTPLRHIDSVAESAKSIMTSLMNALMALDGEGRKLLFEKTGVRKLTQLQVTIAAPWSYTVTKTISYQNNEEFEVSASLIEELLRTAKQKVHEELKENEQMHNLGLAIIARTTMQVIANGYPVRVTSRQKASALKVIEASAVAQKNIIEAIADAQEKMLVDAKTEQFSFMLPYFYTMKELSGGGSEYCLVDITYESTEIGLVRDGVLTYCTHTPFGSFSLARELATVLGVPLEEAYGYLNTDDLSSILEHYSQKQKDEVEEVFAAYQRKLVELFKETGDSLAIPKKIYLHVNLKTEPFFNKQLVKAASGATGMKHAIYNVTTELLTANYPKEYLKEVANTDVDTAMLISAQFFHTQHLHGKFEHL